MGKIGVCQMKPEDVPLAIEIEGMSFTNPWTVEEFKATLRDSRAEGIVAFTTPRRKGKIIGYLVYKRRRRRLDLLTLAVHPDHRRKGAATRLIQSVAMQLSAAKWRVAQAVPTERNLEAQLLLRKCGFKCVEIDSDAYPLGTPGYIFVRGFYDVKAIEQERQVKPR